MIAMFSKRARVEAETWVASPGFPDTTLVTVRDVTTEAGN